MFARRPLLTHAHPDDQGNGSGVTTATYAQRDTEAPQGRTEAPQGSGRDTRTREHSEAGSAPSRTDAALTGAVYATLFLLGFGVGVYGSFYYSLSLGVVPVGAIAAIVVNFVMCWAIRSRLQARFPAALAAGGWLVAVSLLSSQRPEGDLVVTGSPAGYLLILGGAAAAAVAVAAPSGRTGGGSGRPGR